jgi:uncharacterized membrane protein
MVKELLAEKAKKRIAYIDWLRGFACLVMFQTHCYDSWLGSSARHGSFLRYSQMGGTLPAPLFLFLAGFSVALVTGKLRQKGESPNLIARHTILRGLEIFLLALLFRVQEYFLGLFHRPWTDLLRVDILNVIGISIILMGLICRVSGIGVVDAIRLRRNSIVTAIVSAGVIVAMTPPLWSTWQPHWRAWWLESYINGVHNLGTPQSWLFPLFPWSAFAFVGLAVGFLLQSGWARREEASALALMGAGGVSLIAAGLWFDSLPIKIYAMQDFWRTGPDFFLVRAGVVLLCLFASFVWCRWGAGQRSFSPLIEMGKCSLLVYWVHIELVYGGLSILPKHQMGIPGATAGLIIIFVAMTTLAVIRNRFSARRTQVKAVLRRSEA